jgi:hypothetical protein
LNPGFMAEDHRRPPARQNAAWTGRPPWPAWMAGTQQAARMPQFPVLYSGRETLIEFAAWMAARSAPAWTQAKHGPWRPGASWGSIGSTTRTQLAFAKKRTTRDNGPASCARRIVHRTPTSSSLSEIGQTDCEPSASTPGHSWQIGTTTSGHRTSSLPRSHIRRSC